MSLEAIGLKKYYDDFSLSLDLSVSEGETLALVGPSGSGKTTALNLIAGLVLPESGKLLLDGEDISSLPPWKRNISFVFQDLALFPHLNVEGNIAYGLRVRKVPREERRKIAERMLEIVQLNGYGKRRIDTLSGGERQRVAIARSLASSPRALLLDEPFSSLDAPLRKALNMEFREIRSHSRSPCVFVTHRREEAAMLGDRIAIMEGGRMLESGAARELILAPKTVFCAKFFEAGQVLPCSVTGSGNAGIEIRSPLGMLTISQASEYDPNSPGFFIPKDAVRIIEGACTGGRGCFSARCTGVLFEGQQLVIQVLLDPWEFSTGQLAFEFTAGARISPPVPGAILRLAVDQDLLRFVK